MIHRPAQSGALRRLAAFAAIVIAFAVSPPVKAAEDVFQFQKEVSLPSLTEEELIAVPLDADIHNVARDGYPDVRLLGAGNDPIPFLLQSAPEESSTRVRRSWSAQALNARPLADGSLEILVTLKKDDPQPVGLRLLSPLRNYEHRVQVFASADGQDWQPLNLDGLIFDYSRFIDVRHDEVSFPQTPHRRFRIVVSEVTQEQASRLVELTRNLHGDRELGRDERVVIERRPFRIDDIEFWEEREQRNVDNKRERYELTDLEVEADAEEKTTRIHVRTRREPLTEFTLNTPDRNFSRPIEVRAKGGSDSLAAWRTLVLGTITRIEFKELQREDLTVRFPECRHRDYQLVIENADSPPLQITGIRAAGPARELVFFGRPNAPVRLVYGCDTSAAPVYDTVAIQSLLAKGHRPQSAALGPQTARTTELAKQFDLRDWVNDPRWLTAGIVLLALILAWSLYAASRRIAAMPDEPK